MGKWRIAVEGTVQGVGFRPFVYRTAEDLNLCGEVRNTGGEVEILVEGSEKSLNRFLNRLKEDNPALAEVDSLKVSEKDFESFEAFTISESGSSNSKPVFPPDIGVCDECVEEVFDREDRREGFFMNSCTECGPRLTVVKQLPYDRENSSFEEFPMCEECREEYEDPGDRRFHAQTTACPECGPQLSLHNRKGERLETEDSINEVSKRISSGEIAAVKGTGGFHLCCRADKQKPVKKLRNRLNREKPLAVLVKDLEQASKFAKISEKAEKLLKSPQKPITLLEKKEKAEGLAEKVSELHNVGVMLPHSTLQHLLLEKVETPLVMTSANLPGLPMFKENQAAFKGLGNVADCFLTHDLRVVNRVDDSVVRPSGMVLRRSRGFAPQPVSTNIGVEALGMGGDGSNAFAVSKSSDVYFSQHIGGLENVETLNFWETAFNRLKKLTDASPDYVVGDLNPEFNSVRKGREIAEEIGADFVQVQHHRAHVGSVKAEHGVEECVGVALDGFGLGDNGSAWGGEVFGPEGDRKASLEGFKLPGLDKAAERPERVLISILNKFLSRESIEEVLDFERLEHGRDTLKTVSRQVETGTNTVECSSAGRALDAASFLLNACEKRSYRGEPAMKLESLAYNCPTGPELPVEIGSADGKKVLRLIPAFKGLLEKQEEFSEGLLASSFQEFLGKGFGKLAVEVAESSGTDSVCCSGGVMYNRQIREALKQEVESEGLDFYVNEEVPAGDGGLALGQLHILQQKL
ncbi:MAG: carbamoyltransferase HypF [Candidatus Nanohalobium sp.]